MPRSTTPGYQLPVQLNTGGRETQGFVTPVQDKLPQKVAVLPKRILPIIFLPGIMGSNLRLSAARQKDLKKSNNIAWRPERTGEAYALIKASAAQRQMQLDSSQTEVDSYSSDVMGGGSGESPDSRHDNVGVNFSFSQGMGINTPLLVDDPPTFNPRQTKTQKARERGWGEVYFDSYGELLQLCEYRLNSAFKGGQMDEWWKNIVDVEPSFWAAHEGSKLLPIKEKEPKEALKDCWFPVHAMGYNWLKSNRKSGISVGERIDGLIKRYKKDGFQCEKVVVVTHSMGGWLRVR